VIVLAAASMPPLPMIVRVGLLASSTKLPNTNADTINLSDLLIGYTLTSNLSDFITVVAEGANTKLTIDHDGTGALNNHLY
jgi:hypothetical protein